MLHTKLYPDKIINIILKKVLSFSTNFEVHKNFFGKQTKNTLLTMKIKEIVIKKY